MAAVPIAAAAILAAAHRPYTSSALPLGGPFISSALPIGPHQPDLGYHLANTARLCAHFPGVVWHARWLLYLNLVMAVIAMCNMGRSIG
eukprot:1161551-Pelagomonas_calceolata.AAC.11